MADKLLLNLLCCLIPILRARRLLRCTTSPGELRSNGKSL
uniref:Uncharacterized protein n=1 Tax=Siphoviridae sp. ctXBp18 TaxID=2825541 RepID=A0A8S5PK91_9CAUD|nr:MAG TPA: hypothetical protein [Siphoviridae sp. ctXBp18]